MAAHVETGTMAPRYESRNLGHLGLVAGIFDELGIGEAIDRLIPQDREKRVVSVGQAVKALVLDGLGFVNQRLYRVPHFFQDKLTEQLVGAGIRPEHLNDDVTGRALERLYEHGVTTVYARLASQAVRRLGLTPRFGHLDTTSFHVDGQYNSDTPPAAGVIHLTRGYSRDHRPDLNQVVLELIAENQAGIPLWMEPLSGNGDDKTSLRATVKAHLGQLKRAEGLEYGVADSALYTAETLRELEGMVWITRVPETLSAAREAIQAAAPGLIGRAAGEAEPARPSGGVCRGQATVGGGLFAVGLSAGLEERSTGTAKSKARRTSRPSRGFVAKTLPVPPMPRRRWRRSRKAVGCALSRTSREWK